MTAAAFCTITASTKRNPSAVAGQITAPVTHLATFPVTPLWPINAETIQVLELSSPRESKECYHIPDGDAPPDVVEGDVLVHSGTEYIIQYVAEWPDMSSGLPSYQIVVQEIKGS